MDNKHALSVCSNKWKIIVTRYWSTFQFLLRRNDIKGPQLTFFSIKQYLMMLAMAIPGMVAAANAAMDQPIATAQFGYS